MDSSFVTKDGDVALEDVANVENVVSSKRAKAVKAPVPAAHPASTGRKTSSRRASLQSFH